MSQATIASMVNQHALWAVRVKIVIARVTFNRSRLDILQDHLRLIQAREPWLGVGARKRLRGAS